MTTFTPYEDGRICDRCGSLVGSYGEHEEFCPAPGCDGDGALLGGVDASYLYRGRALIFVPDESGETDGAETGVVIAVPPEQVTSPTARRHAPVIATAVSWPRDRKRFGELFDHHIHHVHGPLVTPLNDGWDAGRDLPVL